MRLIYESKTALLGGTMNFLFLKQAAYSPSASHKRNSIAFRFFATQLTFDWLRVEHFKKAAVNAVDLFEREIRHAIIFSRRKEIGATFLAQIRFAAFNAIVKCSSEVAGNNTFCVLVHWNRPPTNCEDLWGISI